MRYVAYGSNLHPLRLRERISSARLVTTSFLHNWSLHFHKRSNDGSGKCNILSGGSGVHVAIFEISLEDKLALDKIEGLGSGYSNILLNLPEIGDCVSYIAEESYIDDSLVPYDWYKELVLIGARTHGFPADYLNRINSLPAHQDPDRYRRARGWNTVELVKAGTQ
ncbi:MAG: gamma-glutamylcyclotransferase family protein [Woeseiaceae bacterium]